VSVNPKPVQAELPMWIGGASPAAVRRTARYGTGWLGGIQTPEQVAPVVAAIKAETAKAGRRIDADHYGGGFAFRFGSWDDPVVQAAADNYRRTRNVDPRRLMAVGETEIVERAREFVAAGVSKFVLRPIAEDDNDMKAQVTALAERVIPTVHAM
jgi:alkanesulfonate monooxygenase SsuD/methylene tetrahydromethanopterin reductase-like flavin-dependent oxidoreductase (luciferase family)